MDKYEYRVKTDQMVKFLKKGAYSRAMEIADTIDWRRVKDSAMLKNASEIYENCGKYQKSRDILFIAYERSPGSRKIVYNLGIVALKLHDIDEALDCYEEFVKLAPKDPNQFILRYKILRAQNAPIDQQIEALEEFKKAEYVEKWAYELAKLYHEAGMKAECLEECDDLILWFSEGKYVYQAMELKMQYKPLTKLQQEKYSRRHEQAKQVLTDDSEEENVKEVIHREAPRQAVVKQKESRPERVEEVNGEPLVDEAQEVEQIREEKSSKSTIKQTVLGSSFVEAIANGMAMVSGKKPEVQPLEMEEEDIVENEEQQVPEDSVFTPEPREKVKLINPDIPEFITTSEHKSLAADEQQAVEKQITGQMRIEEILSGWEAKQREIAKSIEEKKREEEENQKRILQEQMKQRQEQVDTESSVIPDDIQKLMDELEAGILEKPVPEQPVQVKEEKTEAEKETVENKGALVEQLMLSEEDEESEEEDWDDGEKLGEDLSDMDKTLAEVETYEEVEAHVEPGEAFAKVETDVEAVESNETVEDTAEVSSELEKSEVEDFEVVDEYDETNHLEESEVLGLEEADYEEAEEFELEEADYEEAEEFELEEADYEETEEFELEEADYEEAEEFELEEADYEEAEEFELEEADEDGELYEDEAYEDDELYEDEEAYEDDELYEDEEAYEDDELYEDEEAYEDDELYEDEEAYEDDELYEEDEVYEDDELYEDEEAYEDDELYEDEEAYEDDELYEDEEAYEDDESYEDLEELYDEEEPEEGAVISSATTQMAQDLAMAFGTTDESETGYLSAAEQPVTDKTIVMGAVNEQRKAETAELKEPVEEEAGKDILEQEAPKKMSAREKFATQRIQLEELEVEEPEDQQKRSNTGSVYDTGFIVQGRYDLEAQSEIGLKAGLTEEQKKLFSYFVPVRGMSEQIVDVLAHDKKCKTRYGTSRTGNLLIIGRKGMGKTVLAVDVVKAIQKSRKLKQGKVAIVTGEALNKKEVSDILDKLHGGAIIIEKAAKMNSRTVRELNDLMEEQTGELLVVLEEQRKPLERMMKANPDFKKKFTSKLELPTFINDELVTFGQTYAKENGYRIDEMGILALYSRIDMMQREDHAVSVAEVKEIMDEAIEHSQKANVKHLVKRVFGKTTDDADRIILKEQDFKL